MRKNIVRLGATLTMIVFLMHSALKRDFSADYVIVFYKFKIQR